MKGEALLNYMIRNNSKGIRSKVKYFPGEANVNIRLGSSIYSAILYVRVIVNYFNSTACVSDQSINQLLD